MLWFFKRTKIPQADSAALLAYHDRRQLLLYQHMASPYDGPIVKNMAPMRFFSILAPQTLMATPATLMSGYGGIVTGQNYLQPLQNNPSSAAG